MKKFYLFVFLITIVLDLRASHLVGGDLSYTHVSGLTYKVRLKLHRDCGGAVLTSNQNISIVSQSLSTTLTASLPQVSSGVINTYCSSIVTTCTNPASIYPGFEYYVYEGNVTLPAAANDWHFEYSTCCRNGSINNLFNSGSQSYFLYTTLDNLSSPGGFNNSVNFVLDNYVVYNVNQNYIINQSGIDIDGDSLHFSLTSALSTGIPAPCTYASGYSASSPFGSAGSININPISGTITFNNTMLANDVVAVRVDEYRGGQLIASSIRDMQFIFINGASGNNLPSASGVNGSSNYFTSINLCPSSTISFTVNGTDPDLTDSVHVNLKATDITGSTLSSNGALQETVTFSWTPSVADIRPQPYLLVLEAMDSYCAKVSYGYLIFVNTCNQDSVWAGDANADYHVNNYDVLNIGIANGTGGIVRPGATTNWAAEYCVDWTDTFNSGINYKHADCNGDGIVDGIDLNAVNANYGQFHLKNENIGIYKTAGLPDLSFDLNGINATPGATLNIPVMLGSSSAPMSAVYGLAAHIQVSNALSAPLALNSTGSWLGNSSNSFLFTKNINNNDLAFTIVRNNHTNTGGYGQIGVLTVPISTSAPINSDLTLHFTDLKLILNDGTEITDFNVINDSIQITYPAITSDIQKGNALAISPNPFIDYIMIKSSNINASQLQVTILDLFGRVVLIKSGRLGEHSMQLNTSALQRGNYLMTVIDGESRFNRLITK